MLSRATSLPLPSHLGTKRKISTLEEPRVRVQFRQVSSIKGDSSKASSIQTSFGHRNSQLSKKRKKKGGFQAETPEALFHQKLAQVIEDAKSRLSGLAEIQRFLRRSSFRPAKYGSILEAMRIKYERLLREVGSMHPPSASRQEALDNILLHFKKEVSLYTDFVAAQLNLMKSYRDAIKNYENLPIAKYGAGTRALKGTSLNLLYKDIIYRLQNIDTTSENAISLSTIKETSDQLEEFQRKIQHEKNELENSFHNKVIECLLKDAEGAAQQEVYDYTQYAFPESRDSLCQYFKKELLDPLAQLRNELITSNNRDSTDIFLRQIEVGKKKLLKTLSENMRQSYLREFDRLGDEVLSKMKRPPIFGRGFGRGMINILRNIKYGVLYPFRANKKAYYNKLHKHMQSTYRILSEFSMEDLKGLELFRFDAQKRLEAVQRQREELS